MDNLADGYSKKESHLLAEFREQDSYLNSDYESDSEDGHNDSDHDTNTQSKPGQSSTTSATPITQRTFTNSLLDIVDSLLSISFHAPRIPGTSPPRLTLRITRIPPFGHADDRIGQTFEMIKKKGVNLVFGNLSSMSMDPQHAPHVPALSLMGTIRPSLKINLDPTALMALCSDLLHYPLPKSEDEAMKRFFRPKHALKDIQGGRNADDGVGVGDAGDRQKEVDEWWGQSQNSRELVKNIMEEMDTPLIEELRDMLEEATRYEGIESNGDGGGNGNVEFWATREAITYLTEVLRSEEMVGDGMEQQRMRRLIGLDEGDFFEGSRYAGQEGILKGLRIKVFDGPRPSSNRPHQGELYQGKGPFEQSRQLRHRPICANGMTSFHHSMAAMTESCLSDYFTWSDNPNPTTLAALPNFLKPQRLPIPKVATLSLPFPVVSLMSLSHGSAEGMTTLMMGNVVLRDLFSQPRWKVKGWTQGNYEVVRTPDTFGQEDERQLDNGQTHHDREGNEGQTSGRDRGKHAVVWMLPYRSLGEGKRVKFEKGDYSYPTQ